MKTKNCHGLTFIEVMVTLSILSVGIVAIFQSFFVCLKYANHLTYRLHANTMLEHAIALVEKKFKLTRDYSFDDVPLSEIVVINGQEHVFAYRLDLQPAQGMDNLYQLDVTVGWEENGKPYSLSRSAFVTTVMYAES